MAGSSSNEGLPEPPCSRAPRTCLDLLTIPCSHRYAQYSRGSTLFAFATPFPRPGSWRWSDARISTTSRGDDASRSRVSLVGSLHVRGRRLGKHLRWSWAGPVARPCHGDVWERKVKVSSTTVVHNGVQRRLSSVRIRIRHPVRARRHGDSQWVGLMADAERASRQPRSFDDDMCNMTLLIPQHAIYFK